MANSHLPATAVSCLNLFSMQSGALRALEFDRIVEAVRTFALTPMGDERLARLAPSTDPQKVAQLLASTTETTRYLTANALFPLTV